MDTVIMITVHEEDNSDYWDLCRLLCIKNNKMMQHASRNLK